MKAPPFNVAAAIAIAGIAVAIAVWQRVNTVSASEPHSTTEFFRSYDPGPVIAKFAKRRATSSGSGMGSGWREATRTRDYDATVEMDSKQVPALAAALRNDVETNLRAHTRLIAWGGASSGYPFEYESGNAWGYFILEPIEPEPAGQCRAANVWRVRMRFIERWRK